MTREEIISSFAYQKEKAAVEYSQKYANDDELQNTVIDTFGDGAEYGYNLAVQKACGLYQKELEEISILMGRLRKKSKDLIDITASVEQFKKAMEQ